MSSVRSMARLARRLARMRPHEIYVRGRQELGKRIDVIAWRLGMEPRVREPAAADLGRAAFFFTADEIPQILALWRQHLPDGVDETLRAAERICRHEFDLLGYRGLRHGSQIDWHLDPVSGARAPLEPWYRLERRPLGRLDRKVVWELNRHQHLVTLAKAYLLTQDRRFLDELVSQWSLWQEANPYPFGINWASSLEVAFRALSWLWVDALLSGQPAQTTSFLARLRAAQWLNARHISRYLSTYTAPNTHLLGEAVALFMLGTSYPSLPGAGRWRASGWRLTQEQAVAQVQADGFHFEQSTYYHVYALDICLHAVLFARRNSVAGAASLELVVKTMLDILAGISQAGIPVRMGDDDGGRVFDPRRNRTKHMLDPLCIGAAAYRRPDWKALVPRLTEECIWLLGPADCADFLRMAPEMSPAASRRFHSSGIHVMASGDAGRWQLAIDAGPQGTGTCGHGHADALSIQLSGAGREWVIDTGTYSYLEAAGRERFRGTASHNTLEVDHASQAEPVHAFAWTSIPTVVAERWAGGAEWDYFRGAHTGYTRLRNAVMHRRSVVRVGHLWLVRDQALGGGPETHLLNSWHLAADLVVTKASDTSIVARDERGCSLTLGIAPEDPWQFSLEQGEWSPAYGLTAPIAVVRVRCTARPMAELATVLLPGDCPFRLVRIDARRASAYELTLGKIAYRFVFGSGEWLVGDLSGSEEFALFRSANALAFERISAVAK